MHIPDGILTAPVWGITDLWSASWLIIALRRVTGELEDRVVPLMGVLAAFVFAIQMINIPIGGGTSAHFLGGALVGLIVGPWAGFVIISLVLMVQCLLLQDGGFLALGANMFTMAFLATFVTSVVARRVPTVSRFWLGFGSGWCSVFLSSLACASFLSLSHVVPWKVSLLLLGGTHLILGLIEGLVTGTVLQALHQSRPDLIP